MPRSGLTHGAVGFALGLILAYPCWFGPPRQASPEPSKPSTTPTNPAAGPSIELEPPRPWPLATAAPRREPGDWSDSDEPPEPPRRRKPPSARPEPLILAVLEASDAEQSQPNAEPLPGPSPGAPEPTAALPLERFQEVVPPPMPPPPGDLPVVQPRRATPDPLPTIAEDLPSPLPGQSPMIKRRAIEGGENGISPLPDSPEPATIWGNRLRLTPPDSPVRLSDKDGPTTTNRKAGGSRKPVVLRDPQAPTTAPVPLDRGVRPAMTESSKVEVPARARFPWPFRSQPQQSPAPPPSTQSAGYRPGDLTRALVGNIKKSFQPEKGQSTAELAGLVATSYNPPRQQAIRRPSKPSDGSHTVQAGEDFASIAAAHYGTSRLGPALWMFNREAVPTSTGLRPGLSIAVPPRESLPDRADLLRSPR